MKSKVMDRPMFKQGMMAVEVEPMEEVDPENVGIMAGFKDMLADIELPEDEGEDENGTAEMMGRTPDSPEILMNNLRGDMRSVDARKEELADLVGVRAASETPDSVLALLQPVLAGQMMPQMGPPSAPPGMPPMPPGMEQPMPPAPPAGMQPPMPPAPMAPPMPGGGIGSLPTDQGPVQMAQGGIVQRFSEGTTGPDEDQDGGVSPLSADAVSYPPELTERARTEVFNFLARKPKDVPTLSSQVALREPTYRQLLGSDRGATQAQILFDIAQGGLNLAAGVDAEGRPLRGPQSAVSRFSSAFSKVPGQIGARVGEQAKEDRAIKLAAIQAAEKDIESIRNQNAKLVESQRKMFSDVVKASGTSLFGKGDWHWNVVNKPNLLANWASGKTSPEQDNLVMSAITEFENQSKPIVETRTDPDTKLPYTAERPGKAIPPFVQDAIKARRGLDRGTTAPAAAQPATAPAEPTVGTTGVTPGVSGETGIRPGTTPSMQGAAPVTLPAAPGGGPGAPSQEAGAMPNRSLWGTSSLIAGPVSSALGSISGTPGLGDPYPLITQAQNLASQEVENLIAAFIKNDRAAMGEQERLRRLYSVGPKFWDDPAAYRSRLVSIDEELGREMNQASNEAYNNQLPSESRQKARNFLQSAEKFRSTLGVPLRVYSAEDPTYKSLPNGAEYLWQGTIPMIKGGAKRGR